MRVRLCTPTIDDSRSFLASVRLSAALHGSWVAPPATVAAYRAWIARLEGGGGERAVSFFARRRDEDSYVGVFNFSEIVRGGFQSAYLGYYALCPNAGRGYMSEAFALALDTAFRDLRLHRVEANVQPANARSVGLVERVGFVREGYSRRYVKIAGRWRDHLRFAMLAEDWPRARRSLLERLAAAR